MFPDEKVELDDYISRSNKREQQTELLSLDSVGAQLL